MGRRPKQGLDYFPKDVDYYDDFKIMDLMNQYGPLGQTIYDIIISTIYHEGYYLEISIDKLAMKIVRIIGNRWVKDKSFVLQVIQYCADIGLFHKDLLTQNVITSAGIQRRYQEVTVRNKVNKDKYWLIDKNAQPLLTAPKNDISVTDTNISVTEKEINVADNQQKESKENNNNIYMAIVDYLNEKCGTKYQNTAIETVQLILEKISRGFTYTDFKKVIDVKSDEWLNSDMEKFLRPSTLFGKNFEAYLNQKPSSKKDRPKKAKSNNKFNQFPQRNYSNEEYLSMEQKLLNKETKS
jgi:uncharacterized phage protein (TIGR02220 family)